MSNKSVYLDKQITDVTKMYIRPFTIIAMNIFHCFIMWQLHEVNFFGSFLLASHSTCHVYLFGGILWFERNCSYFEIRPESTFKMLSAKHSHKVVTPYSPKVNNLNFHPL